MTLDREDTLKAAETDRGDYDARLAAARVLAHSGDVEAAAERFRQIHDDLLEKGRKADALEALRELADAYLKAGQAGEARVIAEGLVAREPWEPSHIDRFRQSLVMMNVSDPDAVIAERLGGHGPFTSTDPTVVEHPTPVVPQPEPPSAPRGPSGPMESDPTSVSAEFDSPEPAPMIHASPPREDLGEVFQDFRNEVTRQAGTDDATQHITLATTYLEMGMEDEAIQSLKTAAQSPRHRFEAGALLARLFKRRNDLAQAVEWMERAAESPAPSTEAGRALLYELGITLEAMGEAARALGVFKELRADADQYRDVNERVERLARTQTGG